MDDFLHTNSSLNTYNRCPRQFKYKYLDCYRDTSSSSALHIGSAVHLGLEQIHSGKGLGVAQAALTKYFDEIETEDVARTGYDSAKSGAIIGAYFNKYKSDRDLYETVSVEEVFDFTDGGVRFGGKIDTLLKRKSDGRLIHMEHKTSGWNKVLDKTSDYWANVLINRQVALYSFAIAKKYGQMPITIWDVIYKPRLDVSGSKVRQRKTETEMEFLTRKSLGLESAEGYGERYLEEYYAHPEYLIRHELPLLDDEIESLVDESHFMALRINAVMGWKEGGTRENIQWGRVASACVNNFGTCPYLQTCSGFSSLENNPKVEKIETPHPELVVETGENDEWKL